MRVLSWQLVWMLGVIVSLAFLGAFSYELFFVLSTVGFLLLVDLIRPSIARPEWWMRARSILVLGLIGLAVVIARRMIVMV
ncbi:hypothetical protein DV706_17060 (plasmid) [Natronorubrum bangense]|uniref:Uncharacterized protein n=3 Tax=Natronorubrum bangense TaxID=61858 RepID=A0A4D6HGY3_9EURY|nr:hypothetical protein C494_17988 [Natronorubrum bangense JCM 10635]QCC53040.1 hypothetical protein DV706_00210 [Natronorubrum bangense]QCC56267.1 hypothetical protein DV706_17060 [Natronorubrum bangense]